MIAKLLVSSCSHAVIIVRRRNKPSFQEGEVVAKHWVSEFEI